QTMPTLILEPSWGESEPSVVYRSNQDWCGLAQFARLALTNHCHSTCLRKKDSDDCDRPRIAGSRLCARSRRPTQSRICDLGRSQDGSRGAEEALSDASNQNL